MNTHRDTAAVAPTFSAGRLRAIRAVREMTRRDLGAAAEIPATTIITYEIGRCAPSAAALGKLAAALDVPVHALYATPGVDPADDYWDAVRRALPPLTDAETSDLAVIIRRIEARRALHVEPGSPAGVAPVEVAHHADPHDAGRAAVA